MSFIKTTLTLGNIYDLYTEINGAQNQLTGELVYKGLLSQKLPITTKYWLTRLGDKVKSHKDTVDKLRDELVNKYGREVDGKLTVEFQIDKTDDKGEVVKDADEKPIKITNPKFVEFNKEYKELLKEEKELEHAAFKFDDFGFSADENYPVFFEILASVAEQQEKQPA